jgi:hypothetical protein
MCLVQKRGGEGKWEILTKDMFGSQGDERYFKSNLPFYPYTHQRVLWFYDYSVHIKLYICSQQFLKFHNTSNKKNI